MTKILVFDGLCNFCNGWVRFVLDRDSQNRFKFAAGQSAPGKAILEECHLPADDLQTLVLYDHGHCYVRSEAVIRAVSGLGGVWRLTSVALVIPRRLRDAAYDAFAKRRYALFGKAKECPVPDAKWRDKLLV